MQPSLFTTEMLDVYVERGVTAWSMLPKDMETKGMTWYDSYHNMLSHLSTAFNVPLFQICEAAAWLSLGCDWGAQAMPQLIKMLSLGKDGMSVECSTYGPNKVKAFRSLTEGVSFLSHTSPKAARFARTLFDPNDCNGLVCDRHHITAITGYRTSSKPSIIEPVVQRSITPHQYILLEHCGQKSAAIIGVRPHQFQAGIWLYQKVYKYKWQDNDVNGENVA